MGSSEYGLRRVVAFTPEEEEANRSYETSPAVRNELSYAIRSERDPNKRAVLEQSYQQDFGEPSGVGGDDPGYSGALRSAFSAMGVPQDSIPPSASMRTRQSDSEGMLKAAFAAMEDKPVKQKRGIGDIAADTAMGFAKGAGSLVKGVGWLAGSDALTQAGSTAEDYWGAKQSAELQRQLAEVGKAEGVFETIGALWKNPAAIGDYIATSVPQMIPGMGVGSVGARGIVALAGNSARNAALKAGATEAAAMQAGRVAAEKAAEKSAMYFATGANMVGEGAISGGSTGAEVEQFMLDHGATPDQAKSEANKAAMMAGAWTTAGAGIGAGMETKAMLGQLKDAGIKGFAKNVGKEALEEAIQNPGEDYAAYQAKVKLDPTQTFDPGKSATLGAVTGGIMGAGFHAAGRIGERMTDKPVNDGADPNKSKPDQETAPTQEAPQITQPSAFSAEGEHIPYAQAAERTPYSQFNQENYGYSLPAAGTAFAVPATSRTVEGEVLGPLELPPGQKLLPQPPIDGESQRAYDLPRQMLENSEPPQPSVRQLATARGLLNHNPSATPESIARLMRVDDGMAQQLYQMWQQSQGAKNGAEPSNGRNAEVAAQGAQGGRGILPGSTDVLASASAGDAGRASDSSQVVASSMRPAVSAGIPGTEGVAAANQPKALNENAAKRQAVQLTNQGYPTVAFPHPSQSGMWAIGSPEDAQSVAATPRVETPPEQTRNGLTNSGRPSSSWVIRNKTTGEVIMETFERKRVDALNTEKYEAVPILEHLQGLNRQHSGAIAGKPVSDISSGMLAQIAGSNQPAAEKAKNEIARRASAQRITPLQDDRLEELSGYRHRLESMVDEFGWAEQGGRLLRDADGNVSGRTPWIPHSDLWPGRPGKVSEKDARQYVQDALAGKPMPAAGKRFISYLLDYQDMERAQQSDNESELSESAQEVYDAALAEARNISDDDLESMLESMAIKHGDDADGFYAEATKYLKGVTNAVQQRNAGQAGQAAAGSTREGQDAGGAADRSRFHEEANRPDFQLQSHTREEVVSKEDRAADEAVASKDRADQERNHFSLDGGTLPSESSGGTQAGLFTPDGRATQAAEAKTIAGKPVSEMSNDSLERIADGKSASDEAKGKAKEELNRRDAQSNPRTHGVNYADDFAIRPVEIIEHLISTGNIKALYKAAGVKTADAFPALPMDQRSKAYAQYVADGGQPAPTATEAYNDKVSRMEREALVRRLQSDATVLQANGKPFKTEVSAKEFSARNELGDTHEVSKVDSGYVLKRLPEARRPSVIKSIEDRQANDPENQRQERAFSRAAKIGAAANEAVTAYENGETSIEQFEAALDAVESANDKDHFTLERLNQSIAGKPVSEISDKTLEQIAKSSQPSAGKAKAEVARRQQEQNAVDKRIADAEASGIVLSESDKAAIRESLQKAETLNAKANSISIDPMNKGNAFPMGVGFTKITKRTEQRIDASVRRAGDAADLYKKAEVAEKHADALLSGKGTDADIAKKAEQRTEMQRNLIERLLNWKKGDKIGKFTVDRVSFDKDGYPSSYTISGDGIVKGVMDKTDVAREFFGGNKDTLRKLVDEMRVDQADSKHGEGRVEADGAPKTYTIAEHSETIDKLNSGTLTIDAYKDAFARARHGIDALKAEFSAMTKDQIMKTAGLSYQYKNDTKERIVRAAADGVLDDFDPREMKTWTMGTDRHGYISKVTQEDLTAYAERRKARIAEYAAEHKAAAEGAKNPQTIDDFRAFIGLRQREGMNFSEARMQLTPEQRARFDELMAESSRKARNYSADRDSSVRVAAKTTEGQIVETKHTKTGEDLFVVKAAERVERDVFNQWNATAKKLGGWYSSYSSGGAVPGFQFKTRENAAAFLKYLGGNVDEAQSAIQERRDAFADDKSQSAVERLREMAGRLDESADESLGRERKANTARRARFAASAEASANADKAMAQTMRNIAQAIESGSAKFLDRVRQKVQIQMLNQIIGSAQWDYLKAKYPSYAEQEKHKGERAVAEVADYARFPQYTAFRSDLARLGRQMLEIDGAKKLGKQLLSVADDVTDSYLEFAKANLHKVSTFKRSDGKAASFSSRDDAEKAIARSGYKGRAIVLPFKRGQNLIIQSPSFARENGIWEGDDDKKITLNAEAGAEIVAKGKEFGRRLDVPGSFDYVAEKQARLRAIGIETPAEFRAMLREFIAMKQAPKAPDRVKELERSMAGKKNTDGLDFFPTPASVVQSMLDAAELKEGMSVLEPSAGMGHIADMIREAGVEPDVVELANERKELLEAKGFTVVGRDFMEMNGREGFTFGDVFKAPDGKTGIMRGESGLRVRLVDANGETLGHYDRDELTGIEQRKEGYDRILMNPPFGDRRDAQHVRHAFDLLAPGGRLVAIMGEGVFFGQDKKATEFREWLESVGGTSEKLEDGTFLDPSLPVNTGVNARMVVIDRKETDSGVAMFNAKSGSRGNPIDAAALESTIDRVISGSPSHFSRDTVVTASLFADLPAPILAKAKKEGYDSNGRKPNGEKLTGATYDGKVYLVQENISGELEAEETLLHERIHQIVHGNAKDPDGIALRQSLGKLYIRAGAKSGIERMAKEAGIDMTGPLAAFEKVAAVNRHAFLAEEFLAHAEGQRAYEKLPAKIRRAAREFWGEFRDWLRSSKFVRIAEALGAKLDDFTQSDLAWTLKGIRQQEAGTGSKAIRFMTAWHGSPHDHDGFDSSKIGTGEGAQAYGWGHYFAGARAVAEYYRNTLAFSDNEVQDEAEDFISRADGSDKQAVRDLQIAAANEKNSKRKQQYLDAAKWIEEGKKKANPGRLYQVELAPAEDELLDWDKTYSEQSDFVKKALGRPNEWLTLVQDHGNRPLNGMGIYKSLEDKFISDKQASEHLRSIGIRGVKYLDGSSRNAGKGNYNYVIFDDADVKIIGKESRAANSDIQFASNVLSELTDHDELFRYPVSKSSNLKTVFAEVYPGAKYFGEHTREDERDETGADHRFIFLNHLGKRFYVYTTDAGKVWIDVSRLETGDRGGAIYAAVSNWAYNTRRKFQGDPVGVSADATIRRTTNMLSSALRFGTTEHLDASPEQIKGDPEAGVAPLDWGANDVENLRNLIHTFTTTLYNKFPRLNDYHYDFEKQGFFDKRGNPVTQGRFNSGAEKEDAGRARAGEASIRRGVFLKSLISSESSERPGILEHVLNRGRALVDGGLKGLLSKTTPADAGVSVSGGSESIRAIQSIANKFKTQFKGAAALDIRVASTTQDIPPRFRPSPFAEGVFHDDAGLIYLVTANLRDQYGKVNESRAWQVLMHEAVGHFGLAKMMGDRFKGILKNVMQAARANGRVTSDVYQPGHADYATVEAVRLRYPDASDSEVAQEVLARMAETEPGRTLFGYVRAIVRQWLRDMARAAGFKVETTTAELNDLVAKASAYMRSGANLGSVYGSSGLVAASNRGLESRAHIVGDSGRYTDAQRETFSNVGRQVVTPTVKERVAEWTKDWKMRLAQGIADQFAPLKNLDEKAYMLSRMSKGADGALEAMMMYGRVFMRDGVYDVDAKDGGVIDKLLRPLGKEADDFVWWVAGNRADVLTKESASARSEGARLLNQADMLESQAKQAEDSAKQIYQQAGNFPKGMTGSQRAQKANTRQADELMREAKRLRKEASEARSHGNDLKNVSRENLMTPDDIKALKSLSDGKLDFDYPLPNGSKTRDRAEAYKAANEILQQFNKSVMDIAEESGLIDGQARAVWESDFYVPFYRDMEGDKPKFPNVKSGLVRQKAFERLKGGTEKLNSDLLANTLLNWSHLLHASAKNRAAKAALDAAERIGVADRVDSAEKDSVSYRENGNEVHFKVNDPFVLNAVTALEFSGFSGPAMQAMGAFKRWLTMGVTANPAFKIRNLIRDSISVIGTAELSYNIAKNLKQGYAGTSKDSQTYASMLASGGVIRFGSMIEGNRADHVRQLTEKGIDPNTLIDDESKLKMVWNRYAMPLVEAYNELGDRSENINRAAIYEQLRAKGMSHAEASLQARDLMDFSMGGTWSAVRFLTQVVPFANARIQGLYKLGRSANEDPRRMGYVVGTVALASLALLAAYSDDDDWKKREDWDRDTYWWFKIGDTAFRIPKPFEIGAIGTLAERSAELLFDKEMDGERFGKRIGKMVSDTFSMNPTPQMFKPMYDLATNTDSFTGRPIESLGMEKLRPEDRFTTRSSEVAKAIGKAGVLSPVQIDHVIRGYFGWLGTAAVTSVDRIVRLGDDNPRPDMKLRDTFLIGNFVESLPAGSSRYVTQMYEQSKAVEEAYASFEHYLKSGDKEKAEQIYADEKDKIGKRLLMEHGKQTLTALNKQAKAIEENRQMSGEAKRAGLDRIESQKNAVAKRVMTAGL